MTRRVFLALPALAALPAAQTESLPAIAAAKLPSFLPISKSLAQDLREQHMRYVEKRVYAQQGVQHEMLYAFPSLEARETAWRELVQRPAGHLEELSIFELY